MRFRRCEKWKANASEMERKRREREREKVYWGKSSSLHLHHSRQTPSQKRNVVW